MKLSAEILLLHLLVLQGKGGAAREVYGCRTSIAAGWRRWSRAGSVDNRYCFASCLSSCSGHYSASGIRETQVSFWSWSERTGPKSGWAGLLLTCLPPPSQSQWATFLQVPPFQAHSVAHRSQERARLSDFDPRPGIARPLSKQSRSEVAFLTFLKARTSEKNFAKQGLFTD